MSEPRFETLDVRLPSGGYSVHLGSGLLSDGALWAKVLPGGKVLVVSDETVAPLYLDTFLAALGERGAESMVLPAGEAQKSFDAWRSVIDRLVDIGALRDAGVVALGGGVVGDLAGFAAATYMRGIRFVQVPTTLLAQVDASVGGKSAINHPAGKNLVGAFHQPATVIVDSDTLSTLPGKEFAAGMAEVAKYGAIRDAGFFEWLEEHADAINAHDTQPVIEMIARSIRNKAEVVAEDEKERGVRATLNFGHTFAHALETLTSYTRYLHGEAVAIGMVIAATLSERRGLCPVGRADRIGALLEAFSLPTSWPADVTAEQAWDAMAMDKKALYTGLRLILLREIGEAVVDQDSTRRDIVRAIESQKERAA